MKWRRFSIPAAHTVSSETNPGEPRYCTDSSACHTRTGYPKNKGQRERWEVLVSCSPHRSSLLARRVRRTSPAAPRGSAPGRRPRRCSLRGCRARGGARSRRRQGRRARWRISPRECPGKSGEERETRVGMRRGWRTRGGELHAGHCGGRLRCVVCRPRRSGSAPLCS